MKNKDIIFGTRPVLEALNSGKTIEKIFIQKNLITNLNKKIILLNSNYLGKYFKFRSFLYSKELNLKTFNLSKINHRIKISKLLNNNKIHYRSNKKVIYSVNSNKRGLQTVINILKKYIS